MTSSAADRLGAPEQKQPVGWSTGFLAVGRIATVSAVALCLALQQINHDYFPPKISISQYGIGPNGWMFTAWSVVTVIASLAVYRANPLRRQPDGYFLVVGSVGLVIMGIVRTDLGGLQQSWHAKVHMIASIVALVALPLGMALGLNWARTWWRRTGWSLVVVSNAALIMVLVSAAGVATPGWDAQHSWALWQSVAVTLDMVLLVVFAMATFAPARERPGRPCPRDLAGKPS